MQPLYIAAITAIVFILVGGVVAWHWDKARQSQQLHRNRPRKVSAADDEAFWSGSSPTYSVCSNDWRRELERKEYEIRIEEAWDNEFDAPVKKEAVGLGRLRPTSQASAVSEWWYVISFFQRDLYADLAIVRMCGRCAMQRTIQQTTRRSGRIPKT